MHRSGGRSGGGGGGYFAIDATQIHVGLTSENGKIGRFNQFLLTESFQLALKFHSFIPSDMNSTCRSFIHTSHLLLNRTTGQIANE